MKEQLNSLFTQALEQLKTDEVLPADFSVDLRFERTRQKDHGDFATNVAMTLAKAARKNPREIASLIIAALPSDNLISKVEIAGPGFINIFLQQAAKHAILPSILQAGEQFGLAEPNSGRKVMVEFVSANPTGPLHVGHGRGAAYGDALARTLIAAGHTVEREYYVNDAGRQMDILAVSVWLRYLQELKVDVPLPDNCYQGDYVMDMAKDMHAKHGDQYAVTAANILETRENLEDEAALDAIISLAKDRLGNKGFQLFFDRALNAILQDIREDLAGFGVEYDTWFSEKSLFTDGKISAAIEDLKKSEHVYEKGGAWWFRSTAFGDEKDRVVIRDNGQPTYFASDIAYHKDKIDRGFDECIDIWGSDHHGYIARVKASLQALNEDPEKLNVLLVQFAVLWRGGEKVKMSTRSGSYVTLRELRDEIGVDAARFFYAQRKSEQHMDFDLDLAKSQSNDNPVYYVQYAHARICSIFRQAAERNIEVGSFESADLSNLASDQEQALLTALERFPEIVSAAARNYEPHQITYYLRELATAFHSWYNSTKFLDAEEESRLAMLALCAGTQQVLQNGLKIIGVSAPEKM